ncbi:MAG: acyl--CoA ligase [Alphaproteobacteria bacterium]|nr:acyl--CoA ligase [Alphaproteobacteria bacterium]
MTTFADPSPLLGDEYETLGALLQAAAREFPDQEALVLGDRRLTYRGWHEAAMRLGAELVARGFEPGQIGLIYLDSTIEYAIAFAAVQAAGGIATGVNLRLGNREVGAIAERAKPAVVFAHVGHEVPFDEALVLRCDPGSMAAKGPGLPALVERRADDIATIIWTSGTTGLPKGAAMDHANLRAATRTSGPLAAPFGRKINSTPFAHAGFTGKIWEQIAFGMTLVINTPPWTAHKMLQLLVDEHITIGAGVPAQWAKLVELPELASADLSALQVGITATAPAPPELVERVTTALGIPLIVRYSMTECPSMTGTRPGDDAEVLFNTVGRPQRGVEIELVEEDLRPVAAGEIGRIRVRAAQVMRGYWDDPEQTALVLSEDGWLLTSDLARLRPDGNLVIAGRVSDMYIRGGYNVYPIEVERVLSDHPQVRTAAVIGRPAPVIGEIGVAFVEPADPADPPSLAELRAWVASQLADYKAPDELVIVDALPLNLVMKVDKLALRDMLATAEVIAFR